MFDKIKPVFFLNDEMNNLLEEIESKLKSIRITDKNKRKYMVTKARVRSVHSSLSIEENTISLFEVEKIYEKKEIIGKKKEIQEVKNALRVYSQLNNFNYKSEDDFLKAHQMMMKYLDDDNGFYRDHGEGVKKNNEIIYRAPNSILVPSLMNSLFDYLNTSEDNLIIKAIVFHYYFVVIHPFSDGNGRMARLWVSLILNNYNKNFEFIPIEEEIYLNQEEYYQSTEQSHINSNANTFIIYMLKIINSSLDKVISNNQYNLNEREKKIIDLIINDKYIKQERIAELLNVNIRTIKRDFKRLIENKIVERIGPDKTGFWEVL